MNADVEIVVPDDMAKAKVGACLGSLAGVHLDTEPSAKRTPRIFAIWLDALNDATRRQKLTDFFDETWRRDKDAPAVFVCGSHQRITDSTAFLQALALFSSWTRASRHHVDPYIASDPAALRRLVLAHQVGAEGQLIASASVEDGKLVVWSCEPRRYEVATAVIPALASMPAKALQTFEVSSTGSRIHWQAGDVDLNLDSVRAHADPRVRREHQAEMRSEAARYADAIRRLRIEKGLTQAGVPELSERQVRRLEEGQSMPRAATLARLATAHGMSTNEYLSELAKRSARGTAKQRSKAGRRKK
ncbi:MAG: helix-turn-helix domain-containing protein [Deltaproteobacteria bacterium]|nr:helix-turn-helix domain-containing protein [Deltaproteobacteria bacterium]